MNELKTLEHAAKDAESNAEKARDALLRALPKCGCAYVLPRSQPPHDACSLLLDTSLAFEQLRDQLPTAHRHEFPKLHDLASRIADPLFGFAHALYLRQMHRTLANFAEFCASPKSGSKHLSYYPLVEAFIRTSKVGGPCEVPPSPGIKDKIYGYMAETGHYETTLTRTSLFKSYLRDQITFIVLNHQPVWRIRLSRKKIPIHFALEAATQGEFGAGLGREVRQLLDSLRPEHAELLKERFHVPHLGDIDDIAQRRKLYPARHPTLECINEEVFRAGQSLKNAGAVLSKVARKHNLKADAPADAEYEVQPLSLFGADRIDYSLGRIAHYTKTSPTEFQKHVVFTNYALYVDEFLKFGVWLLICLAAKNIGAFSANKKIVETASDLILERYHEKSTKSMNVAVSMSRSNLGDGARPDADLLTAAWLNTHVLLDDQVKNPIQRALRVATNGATQISIHPEEAKAILRHAARMIERTVNWSPPSEVAPKQPKNQAPKSGPTPDGDAKFANDFVTDVYNKHMREPQTGRVSDGILGIKAPQMPAYHIHINAGGRDKVGISLVNIGVGPSNAKTITDHVAVLRPHTFLMLGHCGGLRSSQRLGEYVLADGYSRIDAVLDPLLPTNLPLPPVTRLNDILYNTIEPRKGDNKRVSALVRSGTVMTVGDRNWELQYPLEKVWPIEESRAVGIDMESATIAANGFRFSVPYATLLCVSDRPLHGDLKLPGMADSFYRQAVHNHFLIGMNVLLKVTKVHPQGIPSRRLRSKHQPPFR